jgi:hypothetical protein
VWEWRRESYSCPSGFSDFLCDFCHCVLEFFPIFVLTYDLIFLEFGLMLGDDFLGICSYLVEFHVGKV